MVAASRFLAELPPGFAPTLLHVTLYGSLALTGRGHGTDRAVMLGLLGERPDTIDPDRVPALVDTLCRSRQLSLPCGMVAFDPARDIAFLRERLPRHPNALRFTATGRTPPSAASITQSAAASSSPTTRNNRALDARSVPYPFTTSAELFP